jgi:two-component system sensor histidine kinase KdpD
MKKHVVHKISDLLGLSFLPFTFFMTLGLTAINFILIDWIDYRSLGTIYLLGITIGALHTKKFSVIWAAILSSITWNYLFIPPRFNFHIYSKEDWLMEIMFFVVAIVMGRFTHQIRDKESKNRIATESQKNMEALLSSVSHELKTPLASLKGFSTALIRSAKKNDPDFINDVGEEILSSVERLDSVIQNLLDMSRLKSGYFKIKEDVIEISELVHAAVTKIKKRFPDREIKITHYEKVLFTNGDFLLLQQVIENVLSNACIYSSSKVEVNYGVLDDWIYIDVLDEGVGVRDTQKIFEKFYRERPQVPGGTGLGLAICKSFLELHNGSIEAHNREEKGSIFKINLLREKTVE